MNRKRRDKKKEGKKGDKRENSTRRGGQQRCVKQNKMRVKRKRNEMR